MENVCSLYELGCKEVINLNDGARLGYIRDVEFELDTGKIKSLIIPGKLRFFGLLGRESDRVILWDEIEQMGEDFIFVKTQYKTRENTRKKSNFSIF